MTDTPNIAGEEARAASKIPFRLRLKAWWEGYDLDVRPKDATESDSGAGTARSQEPAKTFERWDESHIEILQSIWGGDHVTAGADAEILRLVKPLGLNPSTSLLHLGAGLGGAARLMAKNFGTWVTGLESEPKLVEAGMALSKRAGFEKKAPVHRFDPEAPDLESKRFDCIFAHTAFFAIEDKNALLKAMDKSLREQGQILFTDFVLAQDMARNEAFEAWVAGEAVEPHLWTLQQYAEVLASLKLDVRVTEDMTRTYCDQVVKAWADYMVAQRGSAVSEDLAPALVEEVELWTRRVQAMQAGPLRVGRLYCIRKGGSRLMSDW